MSQTLRLGAGRIFAGDYKIVRPLKAGGQGSLYVVEQVSTSKLRALKLMLPELVAQPSSRRRFELEARIAARIRSDHVVESIASGVDAQSGTPWLVMELLEGEDLATYVQKKRRLPPAEVLEIFSQLCHALGEAHRQGIIHRDLKPENIFLAAPRRRGVPFMVKVLDFGIARILAESQTQSGSTTSGLGTPMWMAPEQTEPGRAVGPGTDVWPLGLLAFRLLTGYLFWKAPYDPGASVIMLMAEAFMHPLPAASERAAHYKCMDRLPPGFDAWFARCVVRPIEQRFADATDAFGELEPLLVTFSADSLMPGPSVVTPTAEDARSSPIPEAPALGALPTGPGLSTWAGAPELDPEAVRSVSDSEPAPKETPPPVPAAATREADPQALTLAGETDAPAVAGDTPSPVPDVTTGETPESRTADQAPPVQTTARPAPDHRARNVVISAILAGVLLGAGIFALQRGGGRASGSAASAAPVVTAAPTPSESVSSPPAPASASGEAAPEPSASAPASASASDEPAAKGPHGVWKPCKHAGAKCFAHDDCCDRICRKWVCRANTAMADPYTNPR